jgi:hypothetical protein
MGKTSNSIRNGIGLFVLGIIGIFYIADTLFAELSTAWYATILLSLITSSVGLVLLWKKGKHER